MDKRKKLIKWVKMTFGCPLIDPNISDEAYETHMDIVEEDLEMLLSKYNITVLYN